MTGDPGTGVLGEALACGCGRNGPAAHISWCEAWREYLCEACRWDRAVRELEATERANSAALAERYWEQQSSQDRGGSGGRS